MFDPRQVAGFYLEEQLHVNMQRFRGGLVFKAQKRLYDSTLGLREIKKNKTWVPIGP